MGQCGTYTIPKGKTSWVNMVLTPPLSPNVHLCATKAKILNAHDTQSYD